MAVEGAARVKVPFELVEEEEMQAIEAAFQQAHILRSASSMLAAASTSLAPNRARCRFLGSSISRTLPSSIKQDHVRDLEDVIPTQRAPVTLQFPPKKSLCVTDITGLEWCERQVEFTFTHWKPRKTSAMEAGNARHVELETEVVKRIDLDVQTKEDSWAVRIINFMVGTRQLFTEGLTRELPVIAFVEGIWLTGIIDELRLNDSHGPRLIDTKTRLRQSLPSEAQKRNGRLQLMCYKLLWDTMCEQGILSDEFYINFGLDPQQQLSEAVRSHVADFELGSKVDCLQDLIAVFKQTCAMLPVAHQSLKLRYEWQGDHSVLGEEEFAFDLVWLKERLEWHLQFWHGRRQAQLVSESESWKCQFCAFVEPCRAQNCATEKIQS